jgi:hypothetical protein
MSGPTAQTQESRTDKVAVAVTATEKRAVRAIAALRGTDESNLVRSMTIADIVAEFERLRADSDASEEVA